MSIFDLPILECLGDCWPALTEEQLLALERSLGLVLPGDFRQFLMRYNAPCWRDRAVFMRPDPTDEWDFSTLGSGLGIVPESEPWLWDIRRYREEMLDVYPGEFSESFIPIISTLGGMICIEGATERYGQIVERSNSVDANNEFEVRYLAANFSDFLHGLRRNETLPYETLPLFIAVQAGELETLRQYLDRGGDVERENERGWTLLMSAARWSWPRIVRLLLDAGADPNACDVQGLLPMHHAIIGGSLDSVKLLLGVGTNLNHRDEQGRNWARVAEEEYQHRVHRFFESLLD